MKLFFSPLVSMFFIFSTFMHPAEKLNVQSELKTATVFRSGASLTHTASAELRSGDNELVIEGLSSYLDINSIQVNCPAQVTILGSEFSNNFLGAENISPAVKQLKDSLEMISIEEQKLNIMMNTAGELLEVLRLNREIKGTQTGLSVAELAKLMLYYKAKSLEVQNDLLEIRLKKTKLDAITAKITQQITEEQNKNTVSGGRIALQLNAALAGKYEFTVSYITQNAFWTPYYDIRVDNINSPLQFIYKAKISQTTGIDWKKVKLSLSTSMPRQFSNAPIFKTWFLGYINPVSVMEEDMEKSNSITVVSSGLNIKRQPKELGYATTVRLRGIRSITGNTDPLYIVNGTPISAGEFSKITPDNIKSQSTLKGSEAVAIYGPGASNGAIVVTLKDGLEDYITVTDSELDLTYDISIPYDVPTNGKQQIAELQKLTAPATYKYYTAPRLDKDAFLLAQIADWHTLNLLPGEANIIFEGTYIGQSFIDPSNTSDTLNLTLGTDKRVVVTREKVKDFSSVKFLGANKLQTITYDLTIKNNKNEPINIILKDQYPKSTKKEIEVNLLESSGGAVNDEIGVVTWQLRIDPGQNKKLRISYSVKYPKDKVVNLN